MVRRCPPGRDNTSSQARPSLPSAKEAAPEQWAPRQPGTIHTTLGLAHVHTGPEPPGERHRVRTRAQHPANAALLLEVVVRWAARCWTPWSISLLNLHVYLSTEGDEMGTAAPVPPLVGLALRLLLLHPAAASASTRNAPSVAAALPRAPASACRAEAGVPGRQLWGLGPCQVRHADVHRRSHAADGPSLV